MSVSSCHSSRKDGNLTVLVVIVVKKLVVFADDVGPFIDVNDFVVLVFVIIVIIVVVIVYVNIIIFFVVVDVVSVVVIVNC